MHPTIDQIWYCKGLPRPQVFNRWRRELWEQVGPRLEALERENEDLKIRLARFEAPADRRTNDFRPIEEAQAEAEAAAPVKRGPGRPRKHPVEAA